MLGSGIVCARVSRASTRHTTHGDSPACSSSLLKAEGVRNVLGKTLHRIQWLEVAAPDAATAVRIVSEADEGGCMCQQRLQTKEHVSRRQHGAATLVPSVRQSNR